MGVLAPRSAQAGPSARLPIQTSGNYLQVTFKHLPQPLRSHIRSYRTLGQLLKIPPFSAHSARIFILVGILLFSNFRSPCKISEPYNNSFWEKINSGGRQREREKTLLIVDTFRDSASKPAQTNYQ